MKNFLFFLACAFISQVANASTNNYAPTKNNVVVMYDAAEQEFSPFLFQVVMGETLDLKMDSTCPQIAVDKNSQVLCVSKNSATVVGTLGAKVGQESFWAIFGVNWFSNVEIKETVKNGSSSYSLELK